MSTLARSSSFFSFSSSFAENINKKKLPFALPKCEEARLYPRKNAKLCLRSKAIIISMLCASHSGTSCARVRENRGCEDEKQASTRCLFIPVFFPIVVLTSKISLLLRRLHIPVLCYCIAQYQLI